MRILFSILSVAALLACGGSEGSQSCETQCEDKLCPCDEEFSTWDSCIDACEESGAIDDCKGLCAPHEDSYDQCRFGCDEYVLCMDECQPAPDTSSPEDLVSEEDAGEPLIGWQKMQVQKLVDVKDLLSISATNHGIIMTVSGPVPGMYFLEFGQSDGKWERLAEVGGALAADGNYAFGSYFQGTAGGLISIFIDQALNFGEEGKVVLTDLGFNFENREIRNIVARDNFLYMMSKDWAAAEYIVNRGNPAAMQWEQVGTNKNESALGFYCDGNSAMMTTVRNEVLGLGCYIVDADGNAESEWTPCSGFPEHVLDKQSDPYSVNMGLSGDGDRVAAWFEVLKLGKTSYEVQRGQMDGNWEILEGAREETKPSAMLVNGDNIYLAYVGVDGDGKVLVSRDGAPFEPLGEGMEDPSSGTSGPVGLTMSKLGLVAVYRNESSGSIGMEIYKIGEEQ